MKRVSQALTSGATPDAKDLAALTEEFERIRQAGITLLNEPENALFHEELSDWIDLFTRFGAVGVNINQALEGKVPAAQALTAYFNYRAEHEAISKRHAAKPFQTNIAVATRILAPYIKLAGETLYDQVWRQTAGKPAPKASAEVYHFITNVDALKNLRVSRQGTYVRLPRIMEPKTLQPGEWIGISLPNGVTATWVHLLLTSPESLAQGRVQVSRDGGKTWGERSTVQRGNGREGEIEIRHINPKDGINAMRYINVSDAPVTLTLNQFKVDVPADATANVFGAMTDGDMFSAYTLPAGTSASITFNDEVNETNTKVLAAGFLTIKYKGKTLELTAGDTPVAVHEVIH